MPRTLRTFLHLVFIAAVVVTPGVWVATPVSSVIWSFRFAAPILAIIVGWVLLRNATATETLHNHLHDIASHYFERSGLCFRIQLESIDGICHLAVYYQGRYSGTATTQILLVPRPATGRNPFPNINVDLVCRNASFGVVRIPLPIATADQGRQVNCEVYADVAYLAGRGRKVRFQEGIPVTSITLQGRYQFAIRLGVALPSPYRRYESLPTGTILKLPVFVAESLPANAVRTQQTLARPDLSTGGFPVLNPASQA